MKKFFASIIMILLLSGCKQNQTGSQSQVNQTKEINMLKAKIAKFVPVDITYDSSMLTDGQKKVIEYLYRASVVTDSIYIDQYYSRNEVIKAQLTADTSEAGNLRLAYFKIMGGPFDRLEQNKPFVDSYQKPAGANFYPEDMTKDDFNNWLKKNPGDEKSFTSTFTMIRKENGKLTAIPYSTYYKKRLTEAAKDLKEAAKYAENTTLKKYLELRAKAFETNDYFESDLAWMDLKNNTIEPVIGPYEVYEDELFNYKAAFESFITIKDPEESAKLKKFAGYLGDIENHLPIPDKYKNKNRGSESPIVVANEIYAGGEAHYGVQTLAFNLPNDERVREAKGSKKVMLKNVHQAKFEKLLQPIAQIVMAPDQLHYVTFNAFFSHSLMHEISHGVGPGIITVKGKKTTVQKELKETYSTLEECKADVLGMYNNIFMIEKGVYPKEFEKQTYVTFLAGIFRSIRFGINEAHGGGNAIIYNYLLEKGGYKYDDKTQKVSVNFDKIYPALKDLANRLLMIQATGNYDDAKAFIAKYSFISPTMDSLRTRLSNLPVDIRPVFEIQKKIK
jgi:Peptidase family M49